MEFCMAVSGIFSSEIYSYTILVAEEEGKNHVTMRLELKPYEASIVLFREISEEI